VNSNMHDCEDPDSEVWHEYEKLQQRFPGGIRKLKWTIPTKNAVARSPSPPKKRHSDREPEINSESHGGTIRVLRGSL